MLLPTSTTTATPSHFRWRHFLRSKLVILSLFAVITLIAYLSIHDRSSYWEDFNYLDVMADGIVAADLTAASNDTGYTRPRNIRYSAVNGFFLQSDVETDASNFDFRRSSQRGTTLGLVNREYNSDHTFASDIRFHHLNWRRFEHYMNYTNTNAPDNVAYKVIFMGRHGEGYHNVAEAEYGTRDWDHHYSKLDNYTDPHLTPLGFIQAQETGTYWENAMKYQYVPTPQSYYVSPLARCLSTAMLTYSRLELPKWRPFHATVKEQLRETLGVHTCDKRSSKTWIFEHFNGFSIESRFTEHDELWKPDRRETREEQVIRMKSLLDDVFSTDPHTFISFTTHSGSIAAILDVIGHRPFHIQPGGLLPVLVKAEWYDDDMSPADHSSHSAAPPPREDFEKAIAAARTRLEEQKKNNNNNDEEEYNEYDDDDAEHPHNG